MIEVPRNELSRLVAACAIDADERTYCSICGQQAYVYVKEVGALDALATITHAPGCFAEKNLRKLFEKEA